MRSPWFGKGLSFSCAFLLGAAIGAQDAAVLTAALASRDYSKAEREVKAFAKTEEGKALAKPTLQARLAKTKAAFAVAVRETEMPLAKLKDEGQVDAYRSQVETWRKQADETMAFIMSTATYPAPSRMPFSPGDLQVNQAIVEGKVEATIALWNELELVLAGLLGIRAAGNKSPGGGNYASKVAKGKLEDPCEDIVPMLRYKFVDGSRGLERATPKWRIAFRKYQSIRDDLAAEVKLAKLVDLDPGELPKIDPLILAVHYLFSDKLEEAWEKAAELDEAHTALFITIGHRYLMLRNQKPDGDWTKNEISALALVNQYRLSMGLKPLVGNKNVQQAAIDHSKYQAKAGMSHSQSDPKRATPSQRVALTGYKGSGGTENVASTNDTVAAIWMWRMDSGHHKGLLAHGRAVGLAGRGPATFNVGSTTEDPLLDRW
jgi:hypothetical protein